MADRLRVVHYVNQFFGQIGSEDEAGVGPQVVEGPVGPGRLLQQLLGDQGEVVATAMCGDNYFVENLERAADEILELIKPYRPNLLIAGPAFDAGRYGSACGRVCQIVQSDLGIPAITGMFEENPGVDLYRRDVYIVKTRESAQGMAEALERMVGLARKLLTGQEVGTPAEEGYFARGLKKNVISAKTAAERALAILVAKLNDQPFTTEMTRPTFDRVTPPPPIAALSSATIALVTDGGLIHKGNPDEMPSGRTSRFTAIQIEGLDDLRPEEFEAFHFGYDTRYASADPDRLAPVDVMRQLEREGIIGKLLEVIYATAGAGNSLDDSQAIGQGIAERLRNLGAQGVILTST